MKSFSRMIAQTSVNQTTTQDNSKVSNRHYLSNIKIEIESFSE